MISWSRPARPSLPPLFLDDTLHLQLGLHHNRQLGLRNYPSRMHHRVDWSRLHLSPFTHHPFPILLQGSLTLRDSSPGGRHFLLQGAIEPVPPQYTMVSMLANISVSIGSGQGRVYRNCVYTYSLVPVHCRRSVEVLVLFQSMGWSISLSVGALLPSSFVPCWTCILHFLNPSARHLPLAQFLRLSADKVNVI